MPAERPIISFGPPKTYEEAVHRLGDYSGNDDDQLYRMGTLKRMLINRPENLEWIPVESRVLRLKEEDVVFMEKWSFRRDGSLGFRKIIWDSGLSAARTSYFKDIFPIFELARTLKICWLTPWPTHAGDNLVCITAEPDFEDTREDEWFVALLSCGEYNLLVGEKVY